MTGDHCKNQWECKIVGRWKEGRHEDDSEQEVPEVFGFLISMFYAHGEGEFFQSFKAGPNKAAVVKLSPSPSSVSSISHQVQMRICATENLHKRINFTHFRLHPKAENNFLNLSTNFDSFNINLSTYETYIHKFIRSYKFDAQPKG
uniref:Uncharacterized protein n=1 Tax=Strigamia maritima TaxID=126957 RepID=T1J7H8_STRMM